MPNAIDVPKEHVANVVSFFASPDSQSVTGTHPRVLPSVGVLTRDLAVMRRSGQSINVDAGLRFD